MESLSNLPEMESQAPVESAEEIPSGNSYYNGVQKLNFGFKICENLEQSVCVQQESCGNLT